MATTHETATLDALRRLHDAVVRHGCIEGEGPEWLAAFTDLMAAVREAADVLQKAGNW